MNFTITGARQEDMRAILEMSARQYGSDYERSYRRWSDIFAFEPSSRVENFFVARDASGRLAGAIRLVERTISLRGVDIRAVVLAHFMTEPEYFGRGVARKLLEHGERTARERQADLLLCWGRRKIDGMLRRFGLWGVSNYQETRFTAPPPCSEALQSLSPEEADQAAGKLLGLYEGTYGVMPFFYRRSAADFRYLAKVRTVHTGVQVNVLGSTTDPAGYVVMDDSRVHEAAGRPESLLAAFASLATAGKAAVTTLGVAHPFLRPLRAGEYVLTQRRTWEGGHVGKILETRRFLERLSPAMSKDLRRLNVDPRAFRIANCDCRWDGTALYVENVSGAAGPGALSPSERELAPLLLGTFDVPLLAPETARDPEADAVARLLFPASHPYFGPTEEI